MVAFRVWVEEWTETESLKIDSDVWLLKFKMERMRMPLDILRGDAISKHANAFRKNYKYLK